MIFLRIIITINLMNFNNDKLDSEFKERESRIQSTNYIKEEWKNNYSKVSIPNNLQLKNMITLTQKIIFQFPLNNLIISPFTKNFHFSTINQIIHINFQKASNLHLSSQKLIKQRTPQIKKKCNNNIAKYYKNKLSKNSSKISNKNRNTNTQIYLVLSETKISRKL